MFKVGNRGDLSPGVMSPSEYGKLERYCKLCKGDLNLTWQEGGGHGEYCPEDDSQPPEPSKAVSQETIEMDTGEWEPATVPMPKIVETATEIPTYKVGHGSVRHYPGRPVEALAQTRMFHSIPPLPPTPTQTKRRRPQQQSIWPYIWFLVGSWTVFAVLGALANIWTASNICK